jgi:hypothetical protein
VVDAYADAILGTGGEAALLGVPDIMAAGLAIISNADRAPLSS